MWEHPAPRMQRARPATLLLPLTIVLVVYAEVATAVTYNLVRDLEVPAGAAAFVGTELLIGSPFGRGAADDGGSVEVFRRSDGNLERTLRIPGLEPGDRFGFAIAGVGGDVAVGAPGDDGAAVDAGAVFVIDAAGAILLTLRSPAPSQSGQFGFSVAVRGGDIVVGAPFENVAGIDGGAVYLFNGMNGVLIRKFTPEAARGGEFFGAALATVGEDVLVGSPVDSFFAQGAGAVYQFDVATGARARMLGSGEGAFGDLFGAAIAVSGRDVFVGSSSSDVPDGAGGVDEDAGRVYAFEDDSDMPSAVYAAPPGCHLFGSGIGVAGSRLLVAAPGRDADEGRAYLVDVATAALQQFFTSPFPQIGDRFGLPVVLRQDDLVVGARLFRFCGRQCVQGCGDGVVQDDEDCDFGSALQDFCRDCHIGQLEGGPCPTCDDGSRCTDDVCCVNPEGCIRCDGQGCHLCTRDGCFRCLDIAQTCELPALREPCLPGECQPCDPEVCENARTVCVYAPRPGCSCRRDDQCDDHNVCNGMETCSYCPGCFVYEWPCCERGSRCAAGVPLECRDGDACTIDGCDAEGGCRYDPGGCSTTSTTTATLSSSTTSTSVPPRPEELCAGDADCEGDSCDGIVRCQDGRCVRDAPPRCFAGVSCVLDDLVIASCQGESPPAAVAALFRQAADLVARASEKAAPRPKKSKRLLRKASSRLEEDEGLVERLARKGRLNTTCSQDLLRVFDRGKQRLDELLSSFDGCRPGASS